MKHSVLLSLTLATIGCGPAPVTKTQSGNGANPAKAAKFLEKAVEARKNGRFDEARNLLGKATNRAAGNQLHSIQTALESLNRTQAKSIEQDVITQIEDGQCKQAIEYAASHCSTSELFTSAIQKRTDKPLSACILAHVDLQELATASELAFGENAQLALSAHRLKRVRKRVRKAMAKHVTSQIKQAYEQHDYVEVMAIVKRLHDQKIATDRVRDKVISAVRESVTQDVETIFEETKQSLDKAPKALEQTRSLIATAWPEGGSAKAPKKLTERIVHLRFFVGCNTIRCGSTDVQSQWTYGDTPIRAIEDPRSEGAIETLRSGSRVWALARGKNQTLIATSDPGEPQDLIERALKATGWIDTNRLKTEDTSGWLPPGDSLLKTRVWGPLREGEKLFELGYITAIDGKNVTVRRLSDRVEVTLPKAKIHFGLVKADTKVMAYCREVDRLEPALIIDVKETAFEQQGDPLVNLRCLNDKGDITGQVKEGQLAAVRMNPSWLPPRR